MWTSANGCQDTLTQVVTSHFLPAPNFVAPFPCIDPFTIFVDSSTVFGDSIVSWSWDFGDGSGNSNDQNPIYTYGGTSTYGVNLSVTSGFGCSNDTTIQVQVFQGPTAGFSINPNPGHPGDDIYFVDGSTANGSPIVDWQYDFADGSGWTTGPDAIHIYDSSDAYNVIYVVTDAEGCTDTVTQELIIFDGPLVPSAFTPNGDGFNDFLFVLGEDFATLNFRIYNNWGEVIYEATDPTQPGWDGTFKGKDQPMGVYVWTYVVTTLDGVEHTDSGDVSLIR